MKSNYIVKAFIVLIVIIELPMTLKALKKYRDFARSNPGESNIHTYLLLSRIKSLLGSLALALILVFVKLKFY